MLFTLAEARDKWCPMVRYGVGGDDANASNRHASQMNGYNVSPDYARCIADKCAMWRWADANKVGFCGLAGPAVLR